MRRIQSTFVILVNIISKKITGLKAIVAGVESIVVKKREEITDEIHFLLCL